MCWYIQRQFNLIDQNCLGTCIRLELTNNSLTTSCKTISIELSNATPTNHVRKNYKRLHFYHWIVLGQYVSSTSSNRAILLVSTDIVVTNPRVAMSLNLMSTAGLTGSYHVYCIIWLYTCYSRSGYQCPRVVYGMGIPDTPYSHVQAARVAHSSKYVNMYVAVVTHDCDRGNHRWPSPLSRRYRPKAIVS